MDLQQFTADMVNKGFNAAIPLGRHGNIDLLEDLEQHDLTLCIPNFSATSSRCWCVCLSLALGPNHDRKDPFLNGS
jgi:hypothetical protein